ncbi:Na/Pi symporter [Bacillus sp. Marseille-P3661]|uniref:Na/Pi symporter n=1 Tax=Bacillus sp. Marseille-P3661 TaxID=1936234 RepID=UPI000C82CF13|nr:Na/Pi symporter [Bacillus sp. Marseille-P3661]
MLEFFLFTLLIGLFLVGMYFLRTGLFNLSADSLKSWLVTLTDAPWKGIIVGTVITSILQSSSAVMIITIGLVAAKMLTFTQSIGIILGTNIGTTVTTELITFNIESYIIPIAIVGGILFIIKRKNIRNSGLVLLGLSAVFGAMWGFETLAAPLRDMEYINNLLLTLDSNRFYAVLAGIVLTAIIQSSTATTGIIMGFLSAGTMDLETGIAIILGANIGTCVDALIAAIGSGREAKLTAYAHTWLNVIGVFAFYPFIELLASLGTILSPHPDVQLAHISVTFNIITSLIVLPFAKPFGKLILKIHDRKNSQIQ